MEAGELALIAGNSHTVAIFLKGGTVWKEEAAQIGEKVWIGEVVWTEEAHFIFNFNLKSPIKPQTTNEPHSILRVSYP